MFQRTLAATATAVWLSADVVAAVKILSVGREGHGLIGYGINMYNPICASACKDVVPTLLFCNDTDSGSGMGMDMGMDMAVDVDADTDNATATDIPSAECIATNEPYLQTMAYCMSTHCDSSVSAPEREEWWYMRVVGSMTNQPTPNMTYQQALASITTTPNITASASSPLTSAMLINETTYIATANICVNFQRAETLHARYGIILLVTCSLIPMVLSFARFVPLPARIISKFRAYFIDAPLFGGHVVLPVWGRVGMVSRGQTFFMAYIIIINIVLSAVGFRAVQPNAWWSTKRAEITVYITNRAGVLSFANIPLLILYAGRNNILLWLTNWSHSTFLLLHKCVSVLCTIQACLHSAIYLQIYLAEGEYTSESQLGYWVMGIVATLAMSLLLPFSIRPFRAGAYELFLILHIVLSIFVIVGCWYHIIWKFDRQWGYETWLYTAIAVWGFDRVARVLRVLRNGVKQAFVYKIDDDYIRVDIPNVECSGDVYTYFPTLNYKPWENHPFSPASFNSPPPAVKDVEKVAGARSDESSGVDGKDDGTSVLSHGTSSVRQHGITILVRVMNGNTRELAKRAVSIDSPTPAPPVPVLVESSYGEYSHGDLSARLAFEASGYPNVLCIAGGVGVSVLMPFLSTVAYAPTRLGTVKLYWGVRTAPLVRAVEDLMADRSGGWGPKSPWGAIEAHVSIGERLRLEEILDKELGHTGTTVIVCGPAALSDDVRTLVVRKGQRGAVVRFVQENFDW